MARASGSSTCMSLTWAGTAGLAAAGALGLALAISGRGGLLVWMRLAGWAAWALYLAGFLVSMLAAHVNWGGVNALFWQEPRTVGAMRALAVALIVQVVNVWLPWPRVCGLLSAGLAAFVVWLSRGGDDFLLHPGDAIGGSTSPGIQLTFLAMAALWLLAGALLVWYVRARLSARAAA
ncbi:MAG: hypothetical protein M5R40_08025 [Anaerolineae bacterium]|nr:hypothetical protein [Anaerolineae bacterium]